MLKPFYIKKKNIDDRLVPEVSVEDAGKALVVGEDGKITTGEGETKLYLHSIGLNMAAANVQRHTKGMILSFLSDKSSQYNFDELKTELLDGNYSSSNPFLIFPMTRIVAPWTNPNNSIVVNTIDGIYALNNSSNIFITTHESTLYQFTISDGAVTISRTNPTETYYIESLQGVSYTVSPVLL